MTTIKRLTLTNVCVVVMLAICASIAAQDNGGPPKNHRFSAAARAQQPDRPFPPDPTFRFVGSEMRFGGATVKGAPYSATAVTENIQTLKDGTSITRKDTASLYRDGEGRTRVEQTISGFGPFAASGPPRQVTSIQDPVAGVHYMLDAQNKTAQKMKSGSGSGPRPRNHQLSSSLSTAKKESLGTQVIEGVQTEGTRTTFTIPAGQIGNDRPIDIVDERWYSPDLQVVVLSKHSDPRMGEHVYRLTNISRSEPARALFDVPSDYTVTERSFNRGPGPRGMKPPNNN